MREMRFRANRNVLDGFAVYFYCRRIGNPLLALRKCAIHGGDRRIDFPCDSAKVKGVV